MSIELVMLSNHLILCCPFCLQSFPVSGYLPVSWLFASGGQSVQLRHQPFQWIFRVDFLYYWLVGSPCCPRDSQESSPAPQFERIYFLVLSILYGSILASIHDGERLGRYKVLTISAQHGQFMGSVPSVSPSLWPRLLRGPAFNVSLCPIKLLPLPLTDTDF